MLETRRTTLCDVNATVPFRPSKRLPRLGFIFDASVEHIGEELPELSEALQQSTEGRFRR